MNGTNTYIYGLGCIVQVNAITDYFISDTLDIVCLGHRSFHAR